MSMHTLNSSNTVACVEGGSLKQAVIQEVETYFAEHGAQQNNDVSLYDQIIQHMEEGLIKAVMAFTNENEAKSSRILGISRSTLRQRLNSLNYYKKLEEQM